MKKWKVFIVTHGPIRENYYKNDLQFNNENWGFVNVSDKKLDELMYNKYEIIDILNLPHSVPIGKWYAESEAMYNIYNNKIHEKYDYIGFIHYDYELFNPLNNEYQITNMIDEILSKKNIIYFSTALGDYNAKILADINKPNQQVGEGFNCYDYIIKDYNLFYSTNETVDEWKIQIPKNICSAFLCPIKDFNEMMKFISQIIESKKLEIFDTNHNYRQQGGLIERYISVFLDKLKKPFEILELNHRYTEK
jgi:hypothetical protein